MSKTSSSSRTAARRAGRLERPRRRLRANLVQLLFAVAGLGLGLLLPRIAVAPTVASSRVTETLIGVGFGVLGLVSIIFSLLFLVVQWAFSSLSPRLNLFRDDPIVWRTFGLAIGVFVFSVTAALVIGDDAQVSVVVPAAEVVAVLAALALLRALQVKAFASIQLAPTLSAIAGQGRGIVDSLYPRPGPAGRHPAAPLPPLRRAVTWPHRQAILQQLDLRRLVGAAGGAVVVFRARIGDTLQEGAVVAGLHGGDASDAAVLGALVTGEERTFGQDPLFAFRLLADIGLRALSPAVNDPATAVQVLDTIESLLAPLKTRDLEVAEIADDAGAVKVVGADLALGDPEQPERLRGDPHHRLIEVHRDQMPCCVRARTRNQRGRRRWLTTSDPAGAAGLCASRRGAAGIRQKRATQRPVRHRAAGLFHGPSSMKQGLRPAVPATQAGYSSAERAARRKISISAAGHDWLTIWLNSARTCSGSRGTRRVRSPRRVAAWMTLW
jgi:uncharacterized membrane protein